MEILDFSSENIGVNPVITVGAFDGVHLGHQEILKKLKSKAIENNGRAAVITFWPHPRHVLQNNDSLKLLNTREEKWQLLSSNGVDYLIEIPFSHEFASIDAKTFIRRYLVEQFKMRYFLVGYNHHFGKDRLGNFEQITKFADEYGFETGQVPPLEIDEEKVSSTKIRNAINQGDLKLACKFLGYHYSLTGLVLKGQMLGRTIGFPTANISVPEKYKLIPKDGVYAVLLKYKEKEFKGMLNIGHRPTVNKDVNAKTVEVHIFDFNQDIYGEQVTVSFVDKIRDEIKFSGIDDLKANLQRDMVNAKTILG
jgi:riboflavin kinase / FMN adenylyltransferase